MGIPAVSSRYSALDPRTAEANLLTAESNYLSTV
jgi:hypothetical protein